MSPANQRIRTASSKRTGAREASRGSKTEQAVRMQTIREKSALEVQAYLKTAHAQLGAWDEDDQMVLDSVEEDLLEMESDIDMQDDDNTQDQNQSDLDAFQGEQLSWEAQDSEDDTSGESKFRLLVTGGICQLHVPSWFAFSNGRDVESDLMEETSNRLETLEKVASFLSRSRRSFLGSADPWDLGCEALRELEQGKPSVTEDGFTELANIKSGQFTRHRRESQLIWEDGHTPLDILFSKEAKLAWAANAFCQRCLSLGEVVTEQILDNLTVLTAPRNAKEKRRILGSPLNGLGFSEMIIRICLVAGVAWKDVLDEYRRKILEVVNSNDS